MGRADHLLLGDWNVMCFECGFKRKASMMEKNWQGYYVCPEHNEPRHVQDFVRAIPDIQNCPWVQPIPPVTYAYEDITLGFGDGITKDFVFGSGLSNPPRHIFIYQITSVRVAGVDVPLFPGPSGYLIVDLVKCIIRFGTAPVRNARVSATGSESIPSS